MTGVGACEGREGKKMRKEEERRKGIGDEGKRRMWKMKEVEMEERTWTDEWGRGSGWMMRRGDE